MCTTLEKGRGVFYSIFKAKYKDGLLWTRSLSSERDVIRFVVANKMNDLVSHACDWLKY